MPETVDGVVGDGKRDRALDGELDGLGEISKSRDEESRVDGISESRSDQSAKVHEVHAYRTQTTGESQSARFKSDSKPETRSRESRLNLQQFQHR